MIRTKEDLRVCLRKELGHKKVSLRDFVLGNERWYIYHYIKHLRYVEYYQNCNSGG